MMTQARVKINLCCVLRVADRTRVRRGDDAIALEDEVAQKVAARASARQDSTLEDEVARGVVAARDSNNTGVSVCPVSPSRYQDGTDADTREAWGVEASGDEG